jgi:hypothetical protein
VTYHLYACICDKGYAAVEGGREEASVDVQVNLEVLVSAVVVWWLAYHLVYWLCALTRDPSLVAWSLGPLGITIVALREPSFGQRLLQLALAGSALAAVVYASLYVVHPAPIVGLHRTPADEALTVLIPVVAFTLARLLIIARERRFPLWGEARVMAAVQRSRATGAIVFFTATGRTYLRERFGTTPHEFLRMVRY